MFVFGFPQEEKEKKANMLNCVLGELPLKFLGIPISDQHLAMGAFGFLSQKMVIRLDPWKGKFLTNGRRQILINSCLSSISVGVMIPGCLKASIRQQAERSTIHELAKAQTTEA